MIKTPLSTVIGGVGMYTKNSLIVGGHKPEPPFDPASLFENGEQGFWFDPSDLSTMFQDAVGTVPVTGADQPVGLMLDKSKGLLLGSELALPVTPFTVYRDANTSTLSPVIANLEGGKTYLINTTVGNTSPSLADFRVGANYANTASASIVGNVVGIVTSIMTVLTSGALRLHGIAPGANVTITSVSVRELKGNHAYQTTSAARPILRQNATTGAYYLEFDGSDDFLQTSNIDFTTTDKVSLFAGVRKLSDATRGVVFEFGSSSSLSGSFGLYAPNYTNQLSVAFSAKGTLGAAFPYILNLIAPLSFVVTAKASIPDDAVSLKVNNLNQHISTDLGVGNFGNHPLYIGRRTGTSLPFNGHIYSLISVGRLVTDAETKALEKELAKLTGVSLNV